MVLSLVTDKSNNGVIVMGSPLSFGRRSDGESLKGLKLPTD